MLYTIYIKNVLLNLFKFEQNKKFALRFECFLGSHFDNFWYFAGDDSENEWFFRLKFGTELWTAEFHRSYVIGSEFEDVFLL